MEGTEGDSSVEKACSVGENEKDMSRSNYAKDIDHDGCYKRTKVAPAFRKRIIVSL